MYVCVFTHTYYNVYYPVLNWLVCGFADHKGELNNNNLPRIFLLMHRWYLPSTELAGKLLALYPLSDLHFWNKESVYNSNTINVEDFEQQIEIMWDLVF